MLYLPSLSLSLSLYPFRSVFTFLSVPYPASIVPAYTSLFLLQSGSCKYQGFVTVKAQFYILSCFLYTTHSRYVIKHRFMYHKLQLHQNKQFHNKVIRYVILSVYCTA